MSPVRDYVRDRIARRRNAWSGFLALNYELILRDRIGRVSGATPNSVPGLWGHSYIRTYYGWINRNPPDTARMEGGVATTFYVVRSLLALWRRWGTPVPPDLLADLCAFFTRRVGQDGGCGVYTIDHRGVPGIAVHFRHTCFAYLTLAELDMAAALPWAVREKLDAAAEYISKVRDPNELWRDWIDESWPIGAVASYIAARDVLCTDGRWSGRESRLWPGVRVRMLEALAETSSLDLRVSQLRLSGTAESGTEFWPYWEPIANAEFLRLHSTLGCLHLVGEELLKIPKGAERIQGLIAQIRAEAESGTMSPRFALNHEPSLAAACALLQLVLGPWYAPIDADRPFVDSLMSFIEENWDKPPAYHDFWTEFTAPLFKLDEMAPALDVGPWHPGTRAGEASQRDRGTNARDFVELRESVAAIALGGGRS